MGRMSQFQINGCCNIGNDGSHMAITVLILCRCGNDGFNELCVFCLVTGLYAKAVQQYEDMCEVRSVGSLGLVAKNRLQFTNEPPLARALQLV